MWSSSEFNLDCNSSLQLSSDDNCLRTKLYAQVLSPPGTIMINKGRRVVELVVTSCADRPIQVGSHYHFIETNPLLEFDRQQSYGMRLNIPAGTAVRLDAQLHPLHICDINDNLEQRNMVLNFSTWLTYRAINLAMQFSKTIRLCVLHSTSWIDSSPVRRRQ